MSLNGMPLSSPEQQSGSPATRATKGLARDTGSHESVQSDWTRSGTKVLLGRPRPPGREQLIANRLILMGDWRDSFVANT